MVVDRGLPRDGKGLEDSSINPLRSRYDKSKSLLVPRWSRVPQINSRNELESWNYENLHHRVEIKSVCGLRFERFQGLDCLKTVIRDVPFQK